MRSRSTALRVYSESRLPAAWRPALARRRESIGGLLGRPHSRWACTLTMSIEALTPVSLAVSFAVARVGVGADCPCEVKGFTAQIPGHAERCGGDAGDPGGPRGVVTGETG
jgi:hypothetical protein